MAKHRKGNQAGAPKTAMPQFIVKRLSEGGFILVLTCAFYVLLSLWTYQTSDPSWSHLSDSGKVIVNAGGQVGAYISDTLYFVFGYLAYVLPLCFAYFGWVILQDHRRLTQVNRPVMTLRLSGAAMLVCGGCGLLSLDSSGHAIDLFHSAGGVLGDSVAEALVVALNPQGAALLMGAMVLVGMTWLTGLSWIIVLEWIGIATVKLGAILQKTWPALRSRLPAMPKPASKKSTTSQTPVL